VRLSSPVTDVRQDEGGVEVRWMSADGPQSARSRRVILALPFTCYRDVRFDPPPPPAVERMISRSVYGVVRKTFFVFDEEVDASTFTVTDTALGYCSAAQASEGAGGIVSFAGGEPLLPELGLPAEERKERSLRLLRELYDVPEPVATFEKVWSNEYWTRGSYMIMAPGDMALFGAEMGGRFGGVHLAGAEGYAAAPSFMNSAVKAGLRAGREVAEALEADRASVRG
jgi:monoamine oxidase